MTGEQAAAKLPASVRIGPFDFTIELMSRHEATGRSRYGECAIVEQKIRVSEDFASPVKAADTFIHECLHGLWWTMSLEDGDKQERIVCALSTALTILYRDNPWLLGWLADCLK